MIDKIKSRAMQVGVAVSSVLGVFGVAVATHAQTPTVDSVVASSTDALGSAGNTVFGVFFGILPTILLYVVPIILVLWGISWVLSHFRGKRK